MCDTDFETQSLLDTQCHTPLLALAVLQLCTFLICRDKVNIANISQCVERNSILKPMYVSIIAYCMCIACCILYAHYDQCRKG